MKSYKIRHFNDHGLRFICISDVVDYCDSVINSNDPERSDTERRIAFFTGATLVALWTELINSQDSDRPDELGHGIMAKVSRRLQ